MANMEQVEKRKNTKGNREDALLVIYIFAILKKYSSPQNPLSSQEVMRYLEKEYSIGRLEKTETDRKKVRRHLDTLCESYWNKCVKKVEGKRRDGHKWFYDILADEVEEQVAAAPETLTGEEIEFIVDMITSSKIINSVSTHSIVKKLLEKAKCSNHEKMARLGKVKREKWPKTINRELLAKKQEIQLCIENLRQIRFEYEGREKVVIPYGWNSDESGQFIVVAKEIGAGKGEFVSFYLEKIKKLEKGEWDCSEVDESYFDMVFEEPDGVTLESLFSNVKIINNAIKEKLNLAFNYLMYVVKNEKVVVKGTQKQVVPHSLVFHDGKYYLIGYDKEQSKIAYYRVDLISNLACSSVKTAMSPEELKLFYEVERAKEVEKHPLMLAGNVISLTFKVAESALDRVVDAFAVTPNQLKVTKEKRLVNHEGVAWEEPIVQVHVQTTREEAFRWALANADVVEIETQEIRDRIARIAEPIHQLYTQTLPDKVRENIDYVLKEGTFKISYKVDEDTACQTYKELLKRGNLGVVDNVGIAGEEITEVGAYFGDFINAKRLCVSASNLQDLSWASRLVNLEKLELTGLQAEDASFMKELKKLKFIHSPECSFSDFGVLREHTEINWLDIGGNNVTDLSFIENYKNLNYLNITACPIEDYSPLFTTKSRLKILEIGKRALEQIGEENIKAHHIGVDIRSHPDSPFWWLFE